MKPEREDMLAECGRFWAEFSTLVMATANKDGTPEASYAPYVMDGDGAVFVYLSDLSQHTRNLRDIPKASVLFIEDEARAGNLYARRRLTLRCSCAHLRREDARWPEVLDRFQERFGDVVEVLRGLADFHLFRLKPEAATYVRGFAQAYELSGADLRVIRPIGGKDKRPRDDHIAGR